MSFFRANRPVVLGPGEGTHLDVLGDLITLLVSGKQTGGSPSSRRRRRRAGARPCTRTTTKMKPCTCLRGSTKSSVGSRRFGPGRDRLCSRPETSRIN